MSRIIILLISFSSLLIIERPAMAMLYKGGIVTTSWTEHIDYEWGRKLDSLIKQLTQETDPLKQVFSINQISNYFLPLAENIQKHLFPKINSPIEVLGRHALDPRVSRSARNFYVQLNREKVINALHTGDPSARKEAAKWLAGNSGYEVDLVNQFLSEGNNDVLVQLIRSLSEIDQLNHPLRDETIDLFLKLTAYKFKDPVVKKEAKLALIKIHGGARTSGYKNEIYRIDRILGWAADKIVHGRARAVVVLEISLYKCLTALRRIR
ncbi:MAG: hypothetical protein JWQ35_2326 [Bacteriovoracaceae bacterium]|nr:hypothetical protein [Bacteriovoracaceae bacterium]